MKPGFLRGEKVMAHLPLIAGLHNRDFKVGKWIASVTTEQDNVPEEPEEDKEAEDNEN